jgi:hypothetical protein
MSMHETDAFRRECRTEVIAKWWRPYSPYIADYSRDGVFRVYEGGTQCGPGVLGGSLEDAAEWCSRHGYMRLSDWQEKQP